MRNLIIPRLSCSFCGAEISVGETYWYINGFVLCGDCLPDFARMELAPCRETRGKEGEP